MDTAQQRSCLSCHWHLDLGATALNGGFRHACTEAQVLNAAHTGADAGAFEPVSCDQARKFEAVACGPRGACWTPRSQPKEQVA